MQRPVYDMVIRVWSSYVGSSDLLVLHNDEQGVLCAVELALKAGVPTKTHILNRLHRLIYGKDGNPPRIDAPQALALNREPKANVARYDALRGKEVRHAS